MHEKTDSLVPSFYSSCNDEAYAITFTCDLDVQNIINRIRSYYEGGFTQGIEFRTRSLKTLHTWLKKNEVQILDALKLDFDKTPFAAYTSELSLIYEEIRTCTNNLQTWTKPRKNSSALKLLPSNSKIYPSPLGLVAVLGSDNAALHSTLIPIIDALCAGNCVVLSPDYSNTNIASLLKQLCQEVFDSRHVYCLPNAESIRSWALNCEFDKIFFTGSKENAKTVLHAAAEHLSPVCLELDSKSPCFIDNTADIKHAAELIVLDNCINTSQGQISPNYFFVHEDVSEEFIEQIVKILHRYYGKDILRSNHYPHIPTKQDFTRIAKFIDDCAADKKLVFGGKKDQENLKIEPSIIKISNSNISLTNKEIMSPIIPIITWNNADYYRLTKNIPKHSRAFACYIFSNNEAFQQQIINQVSCSEVFVNTISKKKFGELKNSATGIKRGKVGFNCFSRYKSIYNKSKLLELPIRVLPYSNKLMRLKMFTR